MTTATLPPGPSAPRLAQRKLLAPPFHGRRLAAYEKIVEEETVRELASWPEHREFATLPSMVMRITLGAILRAVFGAEGAERLRDLLPPFVTLGSRLAVLPVGKADLGRWSPFGGGTRRCVGAAFATMELNVTLRTILRDFSRAPTAERDERWHSRGIANAPARGGRAVVRRRAPRERSAVAAAGARS
jgi:cytochrome P450